MKRLFLILFFLSVTPTLFAAEGCEINQLKFCEQQDPRIRNMCPEVLGAHLKKTCIVTAVQAETIRKSCNTELKNVCRVAKGEEFLSQYICLTNPENWDKFTDVCLKSLVKGSPHHK